VAAHTEDQGQDGGLSRPDLRPLGYRAEHPRIVEAVEPYPNRWTYHVIIARPEEIDEQVMTWLREAYDFALNK